MKLKNKFSKPRPEESQSRSTGGQVGISTAVRAVGRVKLTDMSRKADAESSASSASPQDGNPTLKKTYSPTVNRKASTGIAAFKSKSGLFSGKKGKGRSEKDETKMKEFKPRLFFLNRPEPSDAEIIDNIGKDVFSKDVIYGFDSIAAAASLMHKIVKEKEKETLMPPSVAEVIKTEFGSAQKRLQMKGIEVHKDTEEPTVRAKTHAGQSVLIGSTKFLGKMIHRKDKHGLYIGSPASSEDAEDVKQKDNPVMRALDTIKLKTQISTDSERSSSSAKQPSKKRVVTVVDEEEARLGAGRVVSELLEEMATVQPHTIDDWNVDGQARGDKVLKPIFIPY